MSDIHKHSFLLYLMEQDGRMLNPAQRAGLQSHLSACSSCRADRQLYQGLRTQASQRWPAITGTLDPEKILRRVKQRSRLRRAILPLRAIIWAGFALLVLVVVQWMFNYQRPTLQVFASPAEEIISGNLLTQTGREGYDYFGGSLDSDGDLLVTGAPLWNSPQVAAGKAYIFRRSTDGEWRSEATLAASDRDDGFQYDQHFGASVGVNSAAQPLPPVVAVGAPGTDDAQAGNNTGAVYIYEYDGSKWVETAKLSPNRTPYAKIGQELSLSGNILAVSGSPEAGEVYSFRREAGRWRELAPVIVPKSPDGEPASVLLDLYGNILALSTFTVQPLNRENYDQPHHRTGIITLYELSGDQWKQVFQIPPQEAFAPAVGFVSWEEHPFGIQVSIGGEEGQARWLAVGKPGFTPLDSRYGGRSDLEPVPGSVVLYERGDRGWVAQAELRIAPGDLVPGALPFFSSDPAEAFFGSSVDIEGSRLAVIATFANTVDIFERKGQGWIYRFRISPGGEIYEADDYQHRIVVLNGSSLFLGSPTELGDGGIFMFSLPP